MTKKHEGWKRATAKYRAANLDRHRAWSRKHAWKKQGISITEAGYERMRQGQNGRCAICHKQAPRFDVDHEKSTGRIRGLLCRQCNQALGMLKDSTDLLGAAIRYLQEA